MKTPIPAKGEIAVCRESTAEVLRRKTEQISSSGWEAAWRVSRRLLVEPMEDPRGDPSRQGVSSVPELLLKLMGAGVRAT